MEKIRSPRTPLILGKEVQVVNKGWFLLILPLLMAVFIAIPAYAQVEVEDLGYQAKPLNPGSGTTITCAPGETLTLGDGAVVMRVAIRDVDYPLSSADDRSNVEVTSIQVYNLGTAEADAIAQIIFLDKDNRCIDNPFGLTNWGDTFSISPGWIIPDEGEQILQVAVRLEATDVLKDAYQGKTLQLELILTYKETPSGFDSPQTFTSSGIEDGAPETIWNGGFESATDNNYDGGILPIGGRRIVQEFTLCDNDEQLEKPVIKEVVVNNYGNAQKYDITSIDLYVKGQPTPIASMLTDAGSGFKAGTPFTITPSNFSYVVPDDACVTFQIGVVISPYAFRGHTIQFHTTIYADEPSATRIDESVAPEITDGTAEVIGEAPPGMSLVIIGSTPRLPAGAEGFIKIHWKSYDPAVGLGGIQGVLSWDPEVIDPIDNPHDPNDDGTAFAVLAEHYELSVVVNHLAGRAVFTLNYDFGPDSTPVIDGDIFKIKVKGVGSPGSRTQLDLKLIQVLDDAIPPNDITANVYASPTEVELVTLGDVDGNGKITVHDALLVAQHIVGLITLSAEELIIADVNQDGTIDSADVAGIARRAITVGAASAVSLGLPRPRVESLSAAVIEGRAVFRVAGAGIAAAELEVYNLSGKKVFTSGPFSGRLEWDLLDSGGRPLANGVYLYVITALGYNGEVVRTKVNKLVILR